MDSLHDEIQEEVSEDFGHSTHELLEVRDRELRNLHSRLGRRKFLLHRFFGSVSVSVHTESKGFRTDEEWYRSIRFTGLNESHIETIKNYIGDNDYNLAIETGKTEAGDWTVEVF